MTPKLPPQNTEAEKGVLTGCLKGAEQYAISRIIPIVKPEMFSCIEHQILFEAMLDIYKAGHAVDIIALNDKLKKIGKFDEVGGIEYLISIGEWYFNLTNLEYQAYQVKDCFVKRNLILAANKILADANDPTMETSELIEQAEKTFLDATKDSITNETADIAKVADRVGKEILARKKGHLRGLSSGYLQLDNKTHGFQGGKLVIIGARASAGKTAFALNIAEYQSIDNKTPTGFISLEMTPDALVERVITGRANVDSGEAQRGYLSPKDTESIKAVQAEVSQAPLFIEPPFDMTPLVIRSKARRLVALHGIKLLFVDYLQLIRTWSGQAQAKEATGSSDRRNKIDSQYAGPHYQKGRGGVA